jgi:hypothetical protein
MIRLLAALLLVGVGLGCVMPKGTEVIVDRRAGRFWTGNGVLLEVSEDRSNCLVAIRNNTMKVEKRWLPCAYVHGRPLQTL